MQLSVLRLNCALICFFIVASTLSGQEYNFSSSALVTIPDNACPTYTTNTILVSTVPTDGSYSLQKVGVNISHLWAEDLDIRLKAPNGTIVELSSDNGAGGSNYQGTFFVFKGVIAENGPINAGAAPFFGNYLPEGNPNTNFGTNLNGSWQLEICDDQPSISGTLAGWSLTFGRTSDCGLNEAFIWCTNTPTQGNATGAGNNADINTYTQSPNFCQIPNPGNANYSGPDVWYKMTVPEATYVSINLFPATTNADLDLFVFSRDCSGLSSGVCLFSTNEGGSDEEISVYMDAGEYSIVVDAKTPVANPAVPTNFTLSVTSTFCLWCSGSTSCIEPQNDLPLGSLVQCEGFDNYLNSGISGQAPLWEKWYYTATDAPVVNNPFGAGKVLKVERTHAQTQDFRVNVMHLLNNRQEGRYRLSWNMYIPSGKTGNYGIQHTQMGAATANRAYQVSFNGNGTGSLQLGGASTSEAAFTYQTNAWNRVVQIIDLGLDRAELWMNGQFIYSWQFSKGDGGNLLQLGAIQFWDLPLNTLFYIDNLCLREVGCEGTPCSGDPNPKCVENGSFYANECEARCAGYILEEWENCTSCGLASCTEPLDDQPEGELINCENLDAYSVGGIDAQTYRWERKTPGSDDAQVAANPFGLGNVLKIERNGSIDPDILFKLGNHTSGRFRLSWRMFVPSGKEAYYNIQHNQVAGNKAYEVLFGPAGTGNLRIGNSGMNAASFTFLPDSWTKVMQIIDINANKAELWINGQFVYSWLFDIGSTQTSQQLYYINFYANTNNLFYVDNICLRKMTCTGIICPGHPQVCMRNGLIYDSDCEARCFGYTAGEWDNCSSVCDVGGTLVHRGDMNLGDNLKPDGLPPALVRTEPAVIAAFGGSLPSPLLCEIFVFNNEVPGTIDLVTNLPPGAKGFIFNCECGTPANPNGCNQIYFGPIDSVYTDAPEGFYYIAILGGTPGPLSLGVFPASLCSSQLNEITSCNVSINPTVGNNLSVSQGAYQSCYNGARAYEGEEVYYSFTLETQAKVLLDISSTTPSGLFLFSHLCAQTCLLYFENDPEGGNNAVSLQTPILEAGVYYVVIDTELPGGPNRNSPPNDIVFGYTACDEPEPYDPPFITSNLTSGGLTCEIDTIAPHRVGLYGNSLSNYPFSTSDLITFFYRNPNGTLSTNDNNNRFWNGSQLMVFNLPKDAGSISPKCSYIPSDLFEMYITRNNGATTTRLVPHYAPIGAVSNAGAQTIGPVNSSSNYAVNGVSIIESLTEEGISVYFVASPNILNPPSQPEEPIRVTVNSSEPWHMSVPADDQEWIHVPANFYNTTMGDRNVPITFDPNPSPIPRESVISVTTVGTNPIFNRTITIRQLGACVPPIATLEGSSLQVCPGDSVSVQVVADSALLAVYKFRWNTGDSTSSIRVLAPASDTISVVITEPNCFQKDTLFWLLDPSTLPDPPFVDGEVSYCVSNLDLPDLTVEVGANQTVDWFSAATGGDTLLLGSTTYSPSAPGTFWAQSRLAIPPGCINPLRTQVILVPNQPATVEAGNALSACQGQSIALSGSFGGLATSVSWSASVPGGSFANASQANTSYSPPTGFTGPLKLYLTSNDPNGACAAAIDSLTLTVTPGASANAGTDFSACQNELISLNGQIGGAAASATWSASVAGGTFSNNNNLSTTYTPPSNFAGTIQFTLTTNDPIGDCPAASDAVAVNYLALPTAMAGQDASICTGSQINLNGSISASANTGTWSASVAGGNFMPNNQSLNAIYQPPSGFSGPITLTLTASQSSGTCPNGTDQLSLTVTPGPSADAGDGLVLCTGSVVTLSGQVGGSATSGLWSASVPGGSFSPNASTLNATYLPPNGFVGDIILTLTTNDPPGDCPAATDTKNISFEAAPSVEAGISQTICAGSVVNLSGSIGGSATGASWTASVPDGTFLPNTQSLNATYQPSSAFSGNITLTLTSIQLNSCPSATDQLTINVSPPATIEAGSDQTLCTNAIANLGGQVGGAASSASWSASTPGGLFAPSASSLNATYLPPNGATGPIILTLTTNDPPGACPAISDIVTLNYVAPPTAEAGLNQQACAGNAISLNGQTGGSAIGGSWSASVAGGTFSPNASTLNATYTPPANFSGNITLTLSANSAGNICPPANDSFVFTVVPQATANAGVNVSTCSGTPVQLNGSIGGAATSATWSATVPGGLFIPNANALNASYLPPAGYTGFIGLTLSTNDPVGDCLPAVGSSILTVYPSVSVDAGVQSAVCPNTQVTLNALASGGNGNFSYNWSNGLGAGATQMAIVSQTTTFTVTVTDTNGCTNTDQVIVPVSVAPIAMAGADQSLCEGQAAQLSGILSGSAISGTWSASVAGGQFSPSNTALNATYLPPAGYTGDLFLNLVSNVAPPCPAATDQIALHIYPLPTLNITSAPCAPNLMTYDLEVSITGSSLASSLGNVFMLAAPGSFRIEGIPAGASTTLTVEDENTNCSFSQIVNAPDCDCQQAGQTVANPSFISDVIICEGDLPQALSVQVPPGTLVNWYASNDLNNPVAPGTNGTYSTDIPGTYYAEAVSPISGCVSLGRVEVSLVIKELPIADAGQDVFACRNDTAVITAFQNDFYTYLWSTGATASFIEVVANEPLSYILTTTQDGCSSSDTVNVLLYPDLESQLSILNLVECHDDSSGVLSIAPMGGTAPYTVQWQNGSAENTQQNLAAGTYFVTVMDDNGCEEILQTSLDNPPPILLTLVSIAPDTNNLQTGAIDISVDGGQPGFSYRWTTNGVVVDITQDIDSLSAGEYVLEITDNRDCVRLDTFTVNPVVVNSAYIPVKGGLVRVYPNPSSGLVYVDLDLKTNSVVTIRLEDVFGKTLNTYHLGNQQQQRLEFDISAYPAGIYFLSIQLDQQQFTQKIIRQ